VIVEGTYVVRGASRERVFEALTDPALLARAVPGCRALVDEGEGVFGLTIEAGAGAVRGAYSGHVRLGEREAPARYEATLDASGSAGSVQASMRAELAEVDGGTEVEYHMDAKVAGVIAGVGQRVLAGVSRKNASAFFAALEEELADQAPSAAASDANGAAATATDSGGSASAPQAPQVYAGARAGGSDDAAMRWFVCGLVVGSLLSAVSIRVAKKTSD
jgi:carbon monoxide dehydrogenase subunit G